MVTDLERIRENALRKKGEWWGKSKEREKPGICLLCGKEREGDQNASAVCCC